MPPLIVALDTPSLDVVRQLLSELKGVIDYYKIGLELFTAYGWRAVELVKKQNAKVFLDLKLHDIPNTAAKCASVICGHEVDMFNVHSLGGLEMMQAVREAVDKRIPNKSKRPAVIGVTVLTSLSETQLTEELGINTPLETQVLNLAGLVKKAGLDGVVSSPQEISLIRKTIGNDFLIVTPGIRPANAASDDQKRTLTPKEAVEKGANYLVIGRPITGAANPLNEARTILNTLFL